MEEYERLLNREIGIRNTAVVVMIAVILLAVVSLVLEYKNMSGKKERIVSIAVCAFIVCASIFFITFAAVGATDIKKDIENQDYVVYYGAYEIEYERHNCYCYIYDNEERIELPFSGKSPDTGIYVGYVVYARNSLIALDWYD